MKKILIGFFILMIVLLVSTGKVMAFEKAADHSAVLVSNSVESNRDAYIEKLALQNVLKRYDSALVDKAGIYVETAHKYDINPYLLVSISGLESYFGRFMVPGTYNGYGWGGGYIGFKSWEDGIETISRSLRENYYNQGAVTIYDVGHKYAESPTWAVRVGAFIRQFDAEEAHLRTVVSVL